MYSLLLVIIYIAFISLGLPDAIFGSAWPIMHQELNAPVAYAGILTIDIAVGTIVSSFFSDKIIRRIGTGRVTTISVGLTAAALFGFSVSGSFWQLLLWGIPYGVGAGCIDSALNNFVALHYKAHHISWLHCFWGIGATAGPYIMGLFLTGGCTWQMGYQAIGLIQLVLTIGMVAALPLWKKIARYDSREENNRVSLPFYQVLKRPGAKAALFTFFGYCALEATAGLWAASYMVMYRGIDAAQAAKWASLFYLGITVGRFFSGFLTMKIRDKNMIRLGIGIIVAGIVMIILPVSNMVSLMGLIVVGLGCAPIYPSMIHSTPGNFGAEISQSVMGMQMAFAYVGSTVMSPLFGVLQNYTGIGFYPYYLLLFVALMLAMSERLNRIKECRNGETDFN